MFKKNHKHKIKTPTGYQFFEGIQKLEKTGKVILETSGGLVLSCALDHRVKCDFGWTSARDLRKGDNVETIKGIQRIHRVDIDIDNTYTFYDIVGVDGIPHYYSDGILSHNCEFVSSDHLLISSIVLQNMRSSNPTDESMGFRFWGEFSPKFNYMVAADISSGVGNDYSVIQVIESPTMRQIAEFRGNSISTVQLYGLIKWIIKKIVLDCATVSRRVPDIYWSFENNGVGESINALYENDPNFPEAALLISNKDNRNGIVTTGKNKILSCMEFKNLVEKTSGGMLINSSYTIAELKNYVSKGKSYEAKPGSTDDCIAALLVIINMLKEVSNMDEDVYNVVYDFSESDEISDWAYDEPPPMLF